MEFLAGLDFNLGTASSADASGSSPPAAALKGYFTPLPAAMLADIQPSDVVGDTLFIHLPNTLSMPCSLDVLWLFFDGHQVFLADEDKVLKKHFLWISSANTTTHFHFDQVWIESAAIASTFH